MKPALLATLMLAALGVACGKPAPPIPVTRLEPAPDTLTVPYIDVVAAAPLGGDRWAVLSVADNAVAIADLGSRKLLPLGAPKAGALRNPHALFQSADTLYVDDWGLRRMTLWTTGGTMVRDIPAANSLRGSLPSARDSAGRFYTELSPPPRRDGSGNRDSAAIVRTKADLTGADTIGRLAPLDLAEVNGDAGQRFERRVLSGNDHWGLADDGSIWIARVYENRVDWIAPDGKVTKGMPLPDPVLQVLEADRELFLRRFPEELRATAEQLPFAIVKPPFENGFSGAANTVWLEKSRAAIDSVRQIQVVGRDGNLTAVYAVPSRGRVVGVGPGSVLVAEQFAEGVRLLRFKVGS